MEFKVKWGFLDQQSKEKDTSRAKVTTLSLGGKEVKSPSRGIKISKSTTDFALWNKVTGGIMPPQGLGFMHMGVVPETVKNITQTNGKFNEKVSESSEMLKSIDSRTIKIIYPRIPKSIGNKISITEENVTAFLDFLNTAAGNDANLLPLPPTEHTLANTKLIKKGIETVYNSTDRGKRKPLLGYVPAFDDPGAAKKILELYLGLDLDVNVFVIDFAHGKKDRTANELIRRLMDANLKGDLGDYYVHAVNVPKDCNSKASATPFYDLPLATEGIDSFHNLLYGGGGNQPAKGQSVVDFNKTKKYSLQSQYGSYNFAELFTRGLLKGPCDCPVCKGEKIESLFGMKDYTLFQEKLMVHRIHLALQEVEEQRRIMEDGTSLLDYLRERPMARLQVGNIMDVMKGAR